MSLPHPGDSEPRFMDIEMRLLTGMLCDSEPLRPSLRLLVHLPTGRARAGRTRRWQGHEIACEAVSTYTEEVLSRR